MKVGTTLELIVLVVVVLGMIYLVQPEPSQDTTETVVASPPPRTTIEVPQNAPPPPVMLPESSAPQGAPSDPVETMGPDLVDIGIGCALFGGTVAGVAYFALPAQLAAVVSGFAAAPGPGPAISPGAAVATVGPVLALGCAAGAMVLPTIAGFFKGEEPRPEEFAVALDQARLSFGMAPVKSSTSLLAPNEQPKIIHVGTYAFSPAK